jgi:hypothetical protein
MTLPLDARLDAARLDRAALRAKHRADEIGPVPA